MRCVIAALDAARLAEDANSEERTMSQTNSLRPRGPKGAIRPYEPSLDNPDPTHEERIEEALDHLAFSVAAIDHNLDVLAKNSTPIVDVLTVLVHERQA
jgi:hypothetical protein